MARCAAAALVAFATLAAGCAQRSPSSPFIRKGAGFVDAGGPPVTARTAEASDELDRAKREALAKRAAEPKAALPSIEGRDPVLREALAALGRLPSAAAHVRVAEEYQRVGVLDFAYDHYSDALRLEPGSVAALDGRARLLRDVGLVGPALADAHRARFLAPSSAAVRNTLGSVLERQGLCREALGQYREALRLDPGAAWAAENAGRLAGKCS